MGTARIDNPPIRHLTARQACARLGVKPATLYSYASRGLVRRIDGGGRTRLYLADDVERLAARSAARRGHAAVAVAALRWGDPVLDSAVTAVGEGGVRYRGVPLDELIANSTPFERVAELLWEAAEEPVWPRPRALRRAPPDAPLVYRLVLALPQLLLADEARHAHGEAREHERARRLLTSLSAALAGGVSGRGSIAERLALAFARPARTPLVDAALVACADHELNASTFAARVAASAGADLYAAVGAGLYAFTGPRHGAACDRVEALLSDCRRSTPERVVEQRLARGDSLPGFGHRLYPDGDPRARLLLDRVRGARGARRAFAVAAAVERATGERPSLDFGLVAVARALGAPPGFAMAMFALGRSAGWIAHVLEQRRDGALLRPRARYVGP